LKEVFLGSTTIRDCLDFAMDAAWQAGQFTLAHFQTGVAVEWKSDESPVTVADKGAEKLLRELIGRRFPDHAVIGEEQGAADKDSNHRWIIDPIDGTQSFIRGVPLYGVLIGLEIDEEMVLGVSHFPALQEMVAAARGEGCRWNGRPARVSRVSRLEDALVAHTDVEYLEQERHQSFWTQIRSATRIQRGWSDCYGHCLVATGRAEIMLDPVMNVWDCAALLPILEEAGGTFTDWNGKATIYGGDALSTNGLLFDDVKSVLAASSTPEGA
jgi:histidinol phosphatase-like enzyme (inositol monophosphatase family)